MSKRSPPAMPPAVLTNTPDWPSPSGEGNRTRNEPDSCKTPRRVTPSSRLTSNLTAPWARLAAKVADVARAVSVRIRPPNGSHLSCVFLTPTGTRNRDETLLQLQRHLAADFGGIEVRAVAGIFYRAP